MLKVSFELHSLRGMGRLFHNLGAALENAPTPQCFVVVLLVRTGDVKTRLGGGLKMTYRKESGYQILDFVVNVFLNR